MYDVIVIGAGPAGSICAHQLAAAGLHVLAVEKAQFPRLKLCGGGVPRKAARLLEGIVDIRRCGPTPVAGSYLAYRNEHLAYVAQEAAGYSLSRAAFDDLLLNAARDAGCEVLMPAEVAAVAESDRGVTVTTGDGTALQGRHLVLATGANGRLQEQLGYTGRREITMALELDVVPRYFPEHLKSNTLFDFGAIPSGYAWIFPKNGFLNVGAYWHRSSALGLAQRELLPRFVRQFDWAQDSSIGKLRGHPVPCHVDYATCNTQHTLLVGDAAGAVENLFGEGIYYALRSGLLAADVLSRALSGNGSLDAYTQRLRSSILAQIKVSRFVAAMFYSHQRFGYYQMVRNRVMNRLYANTVHGIISPRQALLRALFLLPFWPLAGHLKDADFTGIGLLHATPAVDESEGKQVSLAPRDEASAAPPEGRSRT